MQSTGSRRFVFVALLIVIALAVVAFAGAASMAADPDGALAEEKFTASDEVIVAHITDMHYYPLNYCYSDPGDSSTDYYAHMASSMKMVLESTAYNVAALNAIAEEAPDYLLISGDMTLNGEIQGHIELANLLRQLQNKVRLVNPGFQIFVTMGNHDMYNDEAFSYRDGSEHFVKNTTRADISKIYSSLGYPDMTDDEISAYYDTIEDAYADLYPYESGAITGYSAEKGIPFVNSTTAAELDVRRLFEVNGSDEKLASGEIKDYEYGDLSYVAFTPDGEVFIVVDEELSDTEQQHHLGAVLFDSIADYLLELKEEGAFEDKLLIATQHHNALPHFTGEETLLKDFTMYNYEEFADFMADLGVRYVYSGHMHSNDIAYRVSLNGNPLTDIETSSVTGYGGAVRYTKIVRGSVGANYAENFYTRLEPVTGVDLTPVFEAGLMDDEYIERFALGEYVNASHKVTDASEYAGTKLFYNIIDNVVYGSYVNVDFIGGLGAMVAGLLPSEGILKSLKDIAEPLVDNIVVHIEDVLLADYEYGGDKAEFRSSARGAKLCGYIDELLTKAVNTEMNAEGTTLFDFVLGAYLKHVGGFDTSYANATPGDKEALENLANGSVIKALLGVLLDSDSGLLPIVKGLFEHPIDLAKGMDSKAVDALNAIFMLVAPEGTEVDAHSLMLDDILPGVTEMLSAMDILSLDLKGLSGAEFIDDVIDSYVTESLYTSLGEIAHGIAYAFSIDETAEIENVRGEYVLYKTDDSLAASYVEGKTDNTPTKERGMLPSMLTVTFGEEPETDKNFVWFTAKSITGTDIQYIKGTEFDATKAVSVKGESNVYATTTANIDLGIFATLMHVELRRHTVELKGLEPGATYSYRVGDAAKGYWSDVYTFTTAPDENTPFEILLITDIQGSSSKPYTQALDIMAKVDSVFENGYDFVINCGDVVDNSRNLVQWRYYLDILGDYWANTTTVVAAGNHDKYTYEAPDTEDIAEAAEYSWIGADTITDAYSYLLLHYNLSYPEQNDLTGAYYSFDYGAVHFTVLNTNDLNSKGGIGDKQYDWLIDDLDTTDKKFKVVVMHKGLYSAGSHITDTDVVAIRKQLTSVFAEKGVALVLQGHDHTYSESYYIDKDGNVVDTSADATTALGGENGVLYVALGTFGDKFYKYVESDKIPLEFGKELHDPTLKNPTFGKLVFDGENLYYTGYEYDLETGEISEVRAGGLGLTETIAIIACSAVAVGALVAVLCGIRKARKKA